ncbi:MAG: patatin-like phospholipase family protein [Nitrospirota bacterium]
MTSEAALHALWARLQEWIRRLGRTPRIGLALGNGAAWGVGHIGVLSIIRALRIPLSCIAGCSAGAFVGALYAGGIEGDALEACGRAYRWRDAGKLLFPPRMGLATNAPMAAYLQRKIGDLRFDQLRVPLYVVATNLVTGQQKIFSEGPVIPAVRASCAIPGIFEPVLIDGELYSDGTLVNRLPCEVLRKAGADLVIGVELDLVERAVAPANISEVIHRSIEIMLRGQDVRERAAADLLIRPDLDGMNEFGFNKNDALIERGKQAALAQLAHWARPAAPAVAQEKEAGA